MEKSLRVKNREGSLPKRIAIKILLTVLAVVTVFPFIWMFFYFYEK